MGIVSKAILKRFEIKQDVFYAELDWNALTRLASRHGVSYTALPKTHPVRRDLALLLDTAVTPGFPRPCRYLFCPGRHRAGERL